MTHHTHTEVELVSMRSAVEDLGPLWFLNEVVLMIRATHLHNYFVPVSVQVFYPPDSRSGVTTVLSFRCEREKNKKQCGPHVLRLPGPHD